MASRRKYTGVTGYARCKGFGHRWDDYADPNLRAPANRGIGRIAFRCTECTRCKYYDIHLSTLQVVALRYYNMPDDFHEITMDSRAEWKVAYYKELNGMTPLSLNGGER